MTIFIRTIKVMHNESAHEMSDAQISCTKVFQLHCNFPPQFTPHLQQCEFTSSLLPHLWILNCQLCAVQEIYGKMVSDVDLPECEFCSGYEEVRIARCKVFFSLTIKCVKSFN